MKNIIYKIKSLKHFNLFVLISFIIFISLPLFYHGIVHGHDLRFHLSRIISISDGFKNGNIFSYIHSGYLNNYGYGTGLFYSNIFLFIPSILNFLGISVINSYKIFIVLCNILTVFSMYYCMNKVTNNRNISLISSVFYLLNPYRICDVFVRAAVGEVLSFIFIPFVLLGIYEFVSNNGKNWKYLSIGFSGLILSHLLSTIIIFILTLVIFVIYYKKLLNKKSIINLIYSIGCCILLVSFYVFPLLEQYFSTELIVNTNTVSSDISNYTIPLLKIFSGIPHWHNEVFIPSGVGFVLVYVLFLRVKLKKFKFQKLCDISIIIGVITILCATDLLPWESLKIFSVIQFPWRVYMCAIPLLIIAASIILNEYNNKYKKTFRFVLLILLLSTLTPIYIVFNQYKSEYIWKDYSDYNIGGKDYLPKNVDIELLKERGEIIASNNNDVEIEFERKNEKVIVYYKKNSGNTYVELPLLYYKGYYATGNLKVRSGKNGVVRVYLNDSEGNFEVYYKGTTISLISRIISLVTLLSIILYYIFKGVGKYEKRKNVHYSSKL